MTDWILIRGRRCKAVSNWEQVLHTYMYVRKERGHKSYIQPVYTRHEPMSKYPMSSKVPVVKHPGRNYSQVILVTIGAKVVAGVVTEPGFGGLLVESPVALGTPELLLS